MIVTTDPDPDTCDADAGADAGGGPAAPRELELKLAIDPADADRLMAAPLLAGLRADAAEQLSIYHDTPDLALRNAGFSLRVRASRGRFVQTIKAQGAATAGLFLRSEWERALPSAEPAILDEKSPLAGFVAMADRARAAPVFETAVTRRTSLIGFEQGAIELVLDLGGVRSPAGAAPICEIELELKRGRPAALFALARAIDAITPVRIGVQSKSERGYALAAPAAPSIKAAPVALDAEMGVAEGFERIAAACIRQFRLNEDLLLATGGAGALHQARVALRRLRSALSTFRRVLADDEYERFRAGFRGLAACLGEVRDIDVLLQRIERPAAVTTLETARGAAFEAVAHRLAAPATRALMIDASEWIALGAWRRRIADEQPRLDLFAAAALERYRRRIKRAGKALLTLDDEGRHDVRIIAKKLRYSAEFFGPIFTGKKARRRHAAFVGALEHLQSRLGALNDLATAPAVLARHHIAAPVPGGADGGDRRPRLLRESESAFDALIDAPRFWRTS